MLVLNFMQEQRDHNERMEGQLQAMRDAGLKLRGDWVFQGDHSIASGYAAGQRLTTAGTGQVRSTAITATEVLLHASVRGFFRVGDNAVAATVGPGSIPLEAGEKFHLRIASGEFVSFIRDGGTDGSLTIMPVA